MTDLTDWLAEVHAADERRAQVDLTRDSRPVLGRIESERAIVALHRNDDGHCSVCASDLVDLDPLPWPCPTLRALAWGYRHRDGWQAQWAPEGVEVGA